MLRFILFFLHSIFITNILISNEIWRCENNEIGTAFYKLNFEKPEVYFMVREKWKIVAYNTTQFKYNTNKNQIYALSQPNNKAGYIFDIKKKTVYEAYKLGKVNKDYFSKCIVIEN